MSRHSLLSLFLGAKKNDWLDPLFLRLQLSPKAKEPFYTSNLIELSVSFSTTKLRFFGSSQCLKMIKNSHFGNLIFHKIHIFKILFFTKFNIFKVSFSTKLTFFRHQILRNFWINKLVFAPVCFARILEDETFLNFQT